MTELVYLIIGFILGSFFSELGKDIYKSIVRLWKEFRSPVKHLYNKQKGYYYSEVKPQRFWHKGYFRKAK